MPRRTKKYRNVSDPKWNDSVDSETDVLIVSPISYTRGTPSTHIRLPTLLLHPLLSAGSHARGRENRDLSVFLRSPS